MARRKELRYMAVGYQDGFSGTSAVNDTLVATDTVMGVDTHVLHDSATIAHKGVRFTTAGISTVRSVTATQNSTQYTLDMTAPTAGTFTVTHDGNTTSALAYDLTAAAFQTALEGLASIGAGNVTVTELTDVYTITFAGTLANTVQTITVDGSSLTAVDSHVLTQVQDGTTTWEVTFTPAIAAGSVPADDDVITWLPARVEMKVGEGDVEYTENQEAIVDTDRGLLDGQRAGTEQAMTSSSSFVFDWLRASSGDPITVYEALKRIGDASDWHNAAADPCEPYQVDFFMIDRPDCGSEQAEIMFLRRMRPTSISASVQGAAVSIEGTHMATEPEIYRVANTDDAVNSVA
jgi:hypothetical protein